MSRSGQRITDEAVAKLRARIGVPEVTEIAEDQKALMRGCWHVGVGMGLCGVKALRLGFENRQRIPLPSREHGPVRLPDPPDNANTLESLIAALERRYAEL